MFIVTPWDGNLPTKHQHSANDDVIPLQIDRIINKIENENTKSTHEFQIRCIRVRLALSVYLACTRPFRYTILQMQINPLLIQWPKVSYYFFFCFALVGYFLQETEQQHAYVHILNGKTNVNLVYCLVENELK